MLRAMGTKGRVCLPLAGVLLGCFAASAEPPAIPRPPRSLSDIVRLRIPQTSYSYSGYEPFDAAKSAGLHAAPPRYVPLSRPLLSIGSFRMGLGNGGSGAHFVYYDMDTRVLGGNVSGTLDGARGTVRLSWPIGN